MDSSPEHVTTELRGVTCIWDHSVICHPIQVNAPRGPPNFSQTPLTYPKGWNIDIK